MKNLSETRVAWWSRLLAALFIAALAVALMSAARTAWETEQSLSTLWPRSFSDLLGFALFVYVAFLFAFVAFTGRAPTRFLPVAHLGLNPRTWLQAVERPATPLPPADHPGREAALRLRQPMFPWWSMWLFILVVMPVSRMVYQRFAGTVDPFWDFVGPFALMLLLFGLFVLYFIIRRLEDLTTVWRTRWLGKDPG